MSQDIPGCRRRRAEPDAEACQDSGWGGAIPELTAEQAREYFHRSYTSVDGLWFMKAEERWGFEEALELDEDVWKILPKIQARTIKSMLSLSTGLSHLRACLGARLRLEGFDFDMGPEDTCSGEPAFELVVRRCPWQELLRRSGRQHLGSRIGALICGTEMSVWAGEFGQIDHQVCGRMCSGDQLCQHRFTMRLGQPPAP